MQLIISHTDELPLIVLARFCLNSSSVGVQELAPNIPTAFRVSWGRLIHTVDFALKWHALYIL